MKKYIKILLGLVKLIIEEVLCGFRIKIHGISYCLCPGVKFWIHDAGGCDLGQKTWLSENCYFECSGGQLVLGYNNFFNTNCRITCMNRIEIGSNNLFGPNLIIVDHNHRFYDTKTLICKQGFDIKAIKIGSNIWIGGNVTICAGVEICDKVVIGANSVVTKSIKESGVYVGNPLRKVRDLQS